MKAPPADFYEDDEDPQNTSTVWRVQPVAFTSNPMSYAIPPSHSTTTQTGYTVTIESTWVPE